jgi:hypothetical protein
MLTNEDWVSPRVTENPYGVTADMERLAPPRDVPFASESMFFQAWDPEQSVGVWTHIHLTSEDNRMFVGETVIYLPDGELLVDRSAGRAPDDLGPSSGNLSFRVEEPLQRWHVTFDGTAERTTSTALANGPAGAGRATPAGIDLTFVACSPVYDMYTALGRSGMDWGQLHHEQAFTVQGKLRIDGSDRIFKGYGYRDHGRGTRNLAPLGGDTMIFGVFPDGRAIGSLMAWTRDGTVVVEAGFVYDERGFSTLQIECLPHLDDRFGNPPDVVGRFVDERGEHIEIHAKALHQATLTMDDPNHWVIGNDDRIEDPLVMVETPARLTWGDAVGYGNVERNCRQSQLGLVRSPPARPAR